MRKAEPGFAELSQRLAGAKRAASELIPGLKRFAAEHGLKAGQLHYWVYDRRKPRVAEAAAPVFREVMLPGVAEARTTWNAEVVLPDGTIVRFDRGADVARVSAVLGALRRPCSP